MGRPEIQAQPFGNLRTALAEADRFDTYVLDGRPHSSAQTIEVAQAAHAILIPTGQTKDDLRPRRAARPEVAKARPALIAAGHRAGGPRLHEAPWPLNAGRR